MIRIILNDKSGIITRKGAYIFVLHGYNDFEGNYSEEMNQSAIREKSC
jgi:hypothetical protein